MALSYAELSAIIVILGIGLNSVLCGTVDPKQFDPLLFDRPSGNQRNPANPWNKNGYDPLALEGGLNRPTTPKTPPPPQNGQIIPNKPDQGGKRDYVAPKPNPLPQDKDKTSTTPWPELGKRKNSGPSQPAQPLPDPVWVRPTTAAPKRDYVAPNPLLPNNQFPSLPNQANPNSNVNKNPTRDYVNPNFPSKPQTGVNNQNIPAKPQTSVNNNQNIPTKPQTGVNNNQNIPIKPQTGVNPNPTRDYVNPNNPVKPGDGKLPSQMNPTRDFVNPNPMSNPQGVKPSTPKGPVSFIGGSTPSTSTTKPNAAADPKEKNRIAEDNELREFSETLLKKDVNSPMKHVTVNYQGMTRSSSLNDEAPKPLLSISQDAYKIPSVAKLVLLHNNYILESTQNEVYTAQEKIEENNFLDTILPTAVMQHTRNFLIQKGKLEKDPKVFRDLLKTIWFNMYSRGGGKIGSSGFEHVFLAEIKNGTVSGLHNYLYFTEEEKKNKANYLGYMKKIEFDKGAILKYHFNFHDIDKPVGSMFVGTSPELEIALYSTCFIMRPNDVCPLKLAGKNFGIRTYSYRYRGKNMIGSAFPDI